jgi:hypothetical protein
VSKDAARARREFQAQAAEAARQLVDSGHSDLIQASINVYAARFLPGYQVIYVDDGDCCEFQCDACGHRAAERRGAG